MGKDGSPGDNGCTHDQQVSENDVDAFGQCLELMYGGNRNWKINI